MSERILVTGAGGFIGHHLAKFLRDKGYWVRGVDIKEKPEFGSMNCFDEYVCLDLRSEDNCKKALLLPNAEKFHRVYQLAADMGGAGFVFTGKNDLQIMHNSAMINLNFANLHKMYERLFYSSSACMYPQEAQTETNNCGLKESDAYPAHPDSEYGWEKLFSERLYLTLMKNTDIPVRIARFHNIYGPEGTYEGGREKAPAAICRKVALAKDNDIIEVWGDGEQTRSFGYIADCVRGVYALMESDCTEPINIGSDRMITINDLVDIVSGIAGKKLQKIHLPDKPQGVRGRNADLTLVKQKLNWEPKVTLEQGLKETYEWIASQIK